MHINGNMNYSIINGYIHLDLYFFFKKDKYITN